MFMIHVSEGYFVGILLSLGRKIQTPRHTHTQRVSAENTAKAGLKACEASSKKTKPDK